MPSRYQTNVKRWIYQSLVYRDGDYCFHCRKTPTKKRKLEIDHADNNPGNDNPDNLHLLCRSCNLMFRGKTTIEHIQILQNDSAKNVGGGGDVHRSDNKTNDTQSTKLLLGYGNGSAEMQANLEYVPKFEDWVIKKLREYGSISKREAISGGSAFAKCSPHTAERYLMPMTSIYEGVLVEYRENNQTMLKLKQIME